MTFEGRGQAAQEALLAAQSELLSQMQPGYNRLADNVSLELAYHRYNAQQIDVWLAENPSLRRVDQLSEHEQFQVNQMGAFVVSTGFLSYELAAVRLSHIRIRDVDRPFIIKNGKPAAGDFNMGLATVVADDDPIVKNHTTLHEIAHGLIEPGWVAGWESKNPNGITDRVIMPLPGGLPGQLLATRERIDQQYVAALHNLQEGIVDSLALRFSDMSPKEYFGGKYDDLGYTTQHAALRRMNAQQPFVLLEAMQVAFQTGLQDQDQAQRLAYAYQA